MSCDLRYCKAVRTIEARWKRCVKDGRNVKDVKGCVKDGRNVKDVKRRVKDGRGVKDGRNVWDVQILQGRKTH